MEEQSSILKSPDVETGQDSISIKAANTVEIMAAGDLRPKCAKVLEN